MCITESLGYTAEIKNTVNQLYFNIFNWKKNGWANEIILCIHNMVNFVVQEA